VGYLQLAPHWFASVVVEGEEIGSILRLHRFGRSLIDLIHEKQLALINLWLNKRTCWCRSSDSLKLTFESDEVFNQIFEQVEDFVTVQF
jgi:hypothetical protein